MAKTPPLQDLLGDAPKRRPQTPEEQWQIALLWNARLGGKVVYRDTD